MHSYYGHTRMLNTLIRVYDVLRSTDRKRALFIHSITSTPTNESPQLRQRSRNRIIWREGPPPHHLLQPTRLRLNPITSNYRKRASRCVLRYRIRV